jgi:hypothetical protein
MTVLFLNSVKVAKMGTGAAAEQQGGYELFHELPIR